MACCALSVCFSASFAQIKDVKQLDQQYMNWYNQDLEQDNILGISINKAYETLLKGKTPKKKVVVAVIDSGIDIEHEDLKGRIWVNKDEIPANGIDDDKNGYVDDMYGWNFLGNKNGENIAQENYEFVRVVSKKDVNHPDYKKSKELFDIAVEEQKEEQKGLVKFQEYVLTAKSIIYTYTEIVVKNKADLLRVNPGNNRRVATAKEFLMERYNLGFTEKEFEEALQHNKEALAFALNPKLNARAIIGDNPEDLNDRDYGNADVQGPTAFHGTAVAGVIAGVRNNDLGINGITSNVEIMALRAVTDGDEYDKDVALAIIYAVDNGADIINMSFGKAISPQKEFVDQAIKYAEQKGVLLVTGAGNDAQNIDVETSYPNPHFEDGTTATNFLSIGATKHLLDKEIPASFSNYGQQEVDLFAPGVNIITLDTGNMYRKVDGTSFSSPIVAGVAAVILSYYPEITPEQMISLLLESSYKIEKPKKVLRPGVNEKNKRPKVKFGDLSKSGGVVNVYNALKLAEERFNTTP